MSADQSNIVPFEGRTPLIASDAFVAPSAVLVGDIDIGSEASVWYGCILRGDVNRILVGARANLQDGTIVHGSPDIAPTMIGADVLVGHGALIHGCQLCDHSFVGMRAIVLNKCVVETGALVAAGALVTEGTRVPRGEIWGGNPARKIGLLNEKAERSMRSAVQSYIDLAKRHAIANRLP